MLKILLSLVSFFFVHADAAYIIFMENKPILANPMIVVQTSYDPIQFDGYYTVGKEYIWNGKTTLETIRYFFHSPTLPHAQYMHGYAQQFMMNEWIKDKQLELHLIEQKQKEKDKQLNELLDNSRELYDISEDDDECDC